MLSTLNSCLWISRLLSIFFGSQRFAFSLRLMLLMFMSKYLYVSTKTLHFRTETCLDSFTNWVISVFATITLREEFGWCKWMAKGSLSNFTNFSVWNKLSKIWIHQIDFKKQSVFHKFEKIISITKTSKSDTRPLHYGVHTTVSRYIWGHPI